MLTIRFQRVGRKNDPAFRIVVTEKRSKPKSGELEIVGSYHPKTKETRMKPERISYWLKQGAQPSPRVHNLFVSRGVIEGPKIAVAGRAVEAAPGPVVPPPPTVPSGPPVSAVDVESR